MDNEKLMFTVLLIIGFLVVMNGVQISSMADYVTPKVSFGTSLGGVDLSSITSTAASIATVFPELETATSIEDVINILLPTGTPDYSDALGGVSFDDPVSSMEYLAKWYYSLKDEVKNNDPAIWQRYLDLAATPKGISCEFCCGIGPQGITAGGESKCGCQHNPALQALTIGLMKYTDYTDAQILREALKWKTLWFPKNMIEMGSKLVGL